MAGPGFEALVPGHWEGDLTAGAGSASRSAGIREKPSPGGGRKPTTQMNEGPSHGIWDREMAQKPWAHVNSHGKPSHACELTPDADRPRPDTLRGDAPNDGLDDEHPQPSHNP